MNFYEKKAQDILKHLETIESQVNDPYGEIDWRMRNVIRVQADIIRMLTNDIIEGPKEPKCTCLPGSQFVKNSAEDLAAVAMCPIHNPYK